MTKISAINWHKDGWIETECALIIEGEDPVELSLFLPEDARHTGAKTLAAWDGETRLVREVTRGAVTRIGTFQPSGNPLRLHVFLSARESNTSDARRLGGLLLLKTEVEPVIDRRFEPAGPGRTFLAHPDRALVTEFMNIPQYLAGFPPRDAPSDPVLHYLTLGWATGRDPAAGFSSADYMAATPELAESGVNPFVHFLTAALGPEGAADPSARDTATLRALTARLRGESEPQPALSEQPASTGTAKPEDEGPTTPLRAAALSLAAGNRDGAYLLARSALRDPKEAAAAAALLPRIIGTTETWERIAEAMEAWFDKRFYTANQAYALRSGMAADQHYLLTGWQKGLRPSAFFDPAQYASQLPGGLPAGAFPLAHFKGIGQPAGLRGVADGSAYWPVPDVDASGQPPAGTGTLPGATVHVILDGTASDPCPTLRSLLAAIGEAACDICVSLSGAASDAPWYGDLDAMASAGQITVLRAEGSAGTALAAAVAAQETQRPIVVLAHDVQVFPGWLDRLLAHCEQAEAEGPLATVTPLSTHADFAAYPRPDAVNVVATEMAAADIDDLAARRLSGRAVQVPGAGGACALITAEALASLGIDGSATDPVADLGRRAQKAGWRNLVACDVFAPRTGPGVPVTPSAALTPVGQAQLAAEDPLLADATQRHRQAQPLRAARRVLDLGRLAKAAAGATVHLSHRMGGGVETFLRAALRNDPGAVVLRLHDATRLTVETGARSGPFVPSLADIDLRGGRDLLAEVLSAINPDRIVLHSLSGLNWTHQAQVLRTLAEQPGDITFVGHDYAPVSAQYCLLPPDGSPWRGLPNLATLQDWAAMTDPLAELGAGDPQERQAAYDALFAVAAELHVPSEAAAAIYRHYFPARTFAVVPHAQHLPPAQALAKLPPDGRLRIAVPGKIWPHKGSRVIEALATACRNRKLAADITLVGHSDIDERLTRLGVRVTGPYRQEAEVMAHLARLAPDVLLVPSIWPETFCYTLSLAPAMGLRPVVFDLGAQAERARAMPGGVVLPLDLARNADALASALAALARPVPPPAPKT